MRTILKPASPAATPPLPKTVSTIVSLCITADVDLGDALTSDR
jgi:hypothetical protein